MVEAFTSKIMSVRMILLLVALLTLGVSCLPQTKRLMRRVLARGVRGTLRWHAETYRMSSGTTLVVAPHPDDEAFGCGGLIASKRAANQTVHVVYLSDGAASHPGHPTVSPQELRAIRVQEAHTALEKLGVASTETHFLHLPDGMLDRLPEADQASARDRLSEIIQQIQPAEIFLPYRNDGSSEHEGAFGLVRASLDQTPVSARLYEFPVWSWWQPLLLYRACLGRHRVFRHTFPDYQSAKRDAINAYPSQTKPMAPWTHSVLPQSFPGFFEKPEEFYFEV